MRHPSDNEVPGDISTQYMSPMDSMGDRTISYLSYVYRKRTHNGRRVFILHYYKAVMQSKYLVSYALGPGIKDYPMKGVYNVMPSRRKRTIATLQQQAIN